MEWNVEMRREFEETNQWEPDLQLQSCDWCSKTAKDLGKKELLKCAQCLVSALSAPV